MMGESSDFHDILFDDFDGIFDDESSPEDSALEPTPIKTETVRASGTDNSKSLSRPSLQRLTTSNDNANNTDNNNNGSGNEERNPRRRSSAHLDAGERLLPPPTWHSELADRQHRQEMIIAIARLLRGRKKSQPSQDWLKQLPHKARKLENRLYRAAPSLEAYLDKGTLKTRLRKLARLITKQYNESKLQKRFSRTSISSQNTLGSFLSGMSHRDSIASQATVDSMQGMQIDGNPNSVANSQNDKAPSQMVTPSELVAPSIGSSMLGHSNAAIGHASGPGVAAMDVSSIPTHGHAAPDARNETTSQKQQQIIENMRQHHELMRQMQLNNGNGSNGTGQVLNALHNNLAMSIQGTAFSNLLQQQQQQQQQQQKSNTQTNMFPMMNGLQMPGNNLLAAGVLGNSQLQMGNFPPNMQQAVPQVPQIAPNSFPGIVNTNMLAQSLGANVQGLTAQQQLSLISNNAILSHASHNVGMFQQGQGFAPAMPPPNNNVNNLGQQNSLRQVDFNIAQQQHQQQMPQQHQQQIPQHHQQQIPQQHQQVSQQQHSRSEHMSSGGSEGSSS